ncbi:hypothetical protein BCR35DRAFT_329976 [Leucosporidium creatinivorum]|uniref:Uncharacterized protein n=1 Tax=Leucosporidium creatinivorum TaxID=106004 RepID=A0A1Y2FWK8_9BASI|nr:hypothetical protein BCR35DRAFT_329976 [Leucosporidium creatinivorum]
MLHNRDCRTGTRISWWNEEGRKIARQEGWQVVDYERYTRAVSGDTEAVGDGVHYLKTDAMDPIVDDWIGRLGVCGNEDRPK